MEFRRLGRSGLKISEITYGNWVTHGSQVEDDAAFACVQRALDLGITTFDTADVYAGTKAETVLGKALKDVRRDRYLLATKVGQYGDGIFDFSAARVTRSLDESCARLGVDYIDLLQCHDIEFADLTQVVNETCLLYTSDAADE